MDIHFYFLNIYTYYCVGVSSRLTQHSKREVPLLVLSPFAGLAKRKQFLSPDTAGLPFSFKPTRPRPQKKETLKPRAAFRPIACCSRPTGPGGNQWPNRVSHLFPDGQFR